MDHCGGDHCRKKKNELIDLPRSREKAILGLFGIGILSSQQMGLSSAQPSESSFVPTIGGIQPTRRNGPGTGLATPACSTRSA
jgi:hypothetical protein